MLDTATNNVSLFDLPIAEPDTGRWPAVYQILQIAPRATFRGSQSALLHHQKILQIARDNTVPIQFIGYAALFSGERVYRGVGTDWILLNLAHDPLYQLNNQKLIAPRAVCTLLQEMTDAGIDFDAIYIAHEVPVGSVKPGEQVPLKLITPPISPEQRHQLRWLENKTQDVTKFATKSLVGLASSSAKVAAFAAAAPLVLPIAAIGLLATLPTIDPCVFGVKIVKSVKIGPDNTRQWYGTWYRLATWHW